jgi:hypothetical protein
VQSDNMSEPYFRLPGGEGLRGSGGGGYAAMGGALPLGEATRRSRVSGP